jgi:integrase
MNFSRSSMGLHAFQGILRSPQKAPLCNPCPRNELSPLSQEGQPVFTVQTSGADLAAEFIMLTAVRTGEARFMRVREIDFKEKLWTIPAIRMETGDDPDGTDFQVPLCDRAIAILKAAAFPRTPRQIATCSRVKVRKDGMKPLGHDAVLHVLKRGVGYCKSMPSAVRPYERLLGRAKYVKQGRARLRAKLPPSTESPQLPKPTDHVFPGNHIKMFNALLDRGELKLDRDGNRRTAYSLRHTYICMRLMEGADIYQIAKNCRTSVETIEKFYAAHIKNRLDASAINVRRAKPTSRKKLSEVYQAPVDPEAQDFV